MLNRYSNVLTEITERTSLVKFRLKLVYLEQKANPLPHMKWQVIMDKIEQVIALGPIEPFDSVLLSCSPSAERWYTSGLCCYQKLSQVSEFQTEMLPDS